MALISKYSLNGNSTDLVSGINGSDTAISYVGGKSNQCASFNGSSSFIDCGDSALHDGMTDITLSAWIYPNSIIDSYFFSKDDVSNRSWTFDTTNYSGHLGQLDCQFFVGGLASYAFTTQENIIVTNRWQFVQVTRNSSGIIQFFIDGVPVSTTQPNIQSGTINNTSASMLIGKRNYIPQPGYFNGKIDEAEINNGVLSYAQNKNKYAFYQGFI